MRIGILGHKEFVVSRRDMLSSIASSGINIADVVEEIDWGEPAIIDEWLNQKPEVLEKLDVLLISVPAAYMYTVTEQVLRNGLHAYLHWNTSISISEYQKLAELAEEAGSELGIDLPLKYHPLFNRLPSRRSTSVLSIQKALATPSTHAFQKAIEQSLELCYHYANKSEVQRIDAQVVRSKPPIPDTLLASIRFQNGTYIHIHIHQPASKSVHTVHASGTGFSIEVDLEQGTLKQTQQTEEEQDQENGYIQTAFEVSSLPTVSLDEAALKAFIIAIAEEQPAPVSIFDGLQTKRIIEKLRKCLR